MNELPSQNVCLKYKSFYEETFEIEYTKLQASVDI